MAYDSHMIVVTGPPFRHRALVGGTLDQAKTAAEAMLAESYGVPRGV
jgi:hypothetical protein